MATFFADSPRQVEVELTGDQVAYYRHVMELHATDKQTAACVICRTVRCPHWVDAFDKLAAAGQLMGSNWSVADQASRDGRMIVPS